MAQHRERSDIDIAKVVARNMRRFREARGESQKAFAQRTGVNRSRLIGWEKGNCAPTLRTLQRIAEGLDVEVWELLRDPE